LILHILMVVLGVFCITLHRFIKYVCEQKVWNCINDLHKITLCWVKGISLQYAACVGTVLTEWCSAYYWYLILRPNIVLFRFNFIQRYTIRAVTFSAHILFPLSISWITTSHCEMHLLFCFQMPVCRICVV
jgi:hypothetical protein